MTDHGEKNKETAATGDTAADPVLGLASLGEGDGFSLPGVSDGLVVMVAGGDGGGGGDGVVVMGAGGRGGEGGLCGEGIVAGGDKGEGFAFEVAVLGPLWWYSAGANKIMDGYFAIRGGGSGGIGGIGRSLRCRMELWKVDVT